jgi:hypothetical protein
MYEKSSSIVLGKSSILMPSILNDAPKINAYSIGNLSNFQGTLSAVLPIFSTFLLVLNTYIILQNLK